MEQATDRFPIPATEDIRLADVLKALADPNRLRIVELLADGSYRSAAAQGFDLPLQKSTMSHHFKVLREAGLTITMMEGRNCSIGLRREDLESRFPGLLAALTSPAALADLQRA
jgi:DNA-binding transcriptional ArsR family regulator